VRFPEGLRTGVQGLVYLFIALCGAGLGIAAYFGLTFSIIEAGLFALIVALAGVVYLERTLRHRAEARLEKAIDDLSRLLSTDAKAGQVLSQRVNALSDLGLGSRMEVLEADISVLGTVVRQVAEAVSDLEAGQAGETAQDTKKPDRRQPKISLDAVRQAIDEGRLIHHMQPIVTLPQRKTHGYDLIARLKLEDGKLADPPDYMPVRNAEGDRVVRRIERISAEQATGVVRRARMLGSPVRIFIDISPATLADIRSIDQLVSHLSANRAVNPDLFFALSHNDWLGLEQTEADMVERLVQTGVGLALRDVRSLRLDFAGLAAQGVRYLGVDGARFLREPAAFTDFHSSDIADYVRRFGLQMVMTGLTSEQQILSLLDDGMTLAQGAVIAPPSPIRHDLRDEDDDDLQRASGR
jgi:cyclic-di-GMP phosphodiesterase, flagellum assembly factor TipF